MIPRLRPSRLRRARGGALLAATLALTACLGDDPTSPADAGAATVELTATGALSLASLGDTAVLRTRVLDRAGADLGAVPLRWTASPAGIVEPAGDGRYRAVGNGVVTIVAEIDRAGSGARPAGYWVGRLADTLVLEVRQRPAMLALEPVDTAFTMLDARRQLRVRVADARGNPIEGGALPALTWRSANAAVVAVDSTGVVRSVAEGAAQVTVEGGDFAGAATFTVQPRLPHTSCMSFSRRRQAQQSCVTLQLVVRARDTSVGGAP